MIALGVLRDNSDDEVADIVRNFRPDEVAVLAHHHDHRAAGWLTAILPDPPRLWFIATVDDPATAERLSRGPVAISLEMSGRGVRPRPDEPGIVMPVVLPSPYRGVVGPGWTLQAVAVLRDGDRPGAKGSAMWAAS